MNLGQLGPAPILANSPPGTTAVISTPTVVAPPGVVVASAPEPEPTGRSSWWWILIVIIVIIIIVAVILILIYAFRTTDDRRLNESCDDRNKCTSGLVCQSGVCKAAIGSTCGTKADCVSSATACTNSVCVTTTAGGLNDPCNTTDQQCGAGLTCTSGVCKSNIGQPCSRLSDCVASATGCTGGRCVDTQGGLNQRPPCQAGLVADGSTGLCRQPNGTSCMSDGVCLTGSMCTNNVCTPIGGNGNNGGRGSVCTMDSDCMMGLDCISGRCEDRRRRKKHHHSRHHRRYDDYDDYGRDGYRDDTDDQDFGLGGPAANLVGPPCSDNSCPSGTYCAGSMIEDSNGNTVYTFNDVEIVDIVNMNQDIYLVTSNGSILYDNGRSVTEIQSDLAVDRLHVFGNWLYAVSDGCLYYLDTDTVNSRPWYWQEVKWAPTDISHSSVTNDGNWIWLQSHTSGNLYQFVGHSTRPKLREKTSINIGTIRNYGNDNANYLEINTLTQTGTQYPSTRPINDIVDGVILEDGSVRTITTNDVDLKSVLNVNMMDYYISGRRCKSY